MIPTTTTTTVSSFSIQPTLILQCNVVKVCEEILEMIKECDTAIDNLTVQGVIDDQLSNKFTTFSYTLKNLGMHAITMEATIQYFIQISCNKLQDYRLFYTAMGGKDPSVIYDSKHPPVITVTNKSIYYIEGSVDNVGFVPSLPQQQDNNNKTTTNSSSSSSSSNTTKKGRSKAKYITMDNTEDTYHLSQIVNNNNNNNNNNHNNTRNINDVVDTHTQKMNEFTLLLREYMKNYESLKKDSTLKNDIDNLLSYKDTILKDPLITESIANLSIFNCSGPLNQIVQIIETEKTNLTEYVMNVVQRSRLCREYYNTHHNHNNTQDKNGRKQFITSIYTKL